MTMRLKSEDLLIEIGCEELPAKDLKKRLNDFILEIKTELSKLELNPGSIKGYVTPRRLAVIISNLIEKTPDRMVFKKGPTKKAAFDSTGKPTQAALKFAESCGVPVEKLSLQETEKGSWLVFEESVPGKLTTDFIPALLENALENLPMGRRMRWGSQEHKFLRPIHWIVLLYGTEVIPAELFGVKTDRFSFGHRFHHPQAISIATALEYEAKLEAGFVMVDFAKRQATICNGMLKIAADYKANAVLDETLLDEVTGLVEWPVVLTGQFEEAFLALPKEVLISTMQVHQKCFATVNPKGELLSRFILVSNIESKDPKMVILGNESVMRARLSDAAFYYDIDREKSLEQRQADLKNIIFQAGLGTLFDKTQRVAYIAHLIAEAIAADPKVAERAGLLCKADLTTQMVGEFPELQGIMGYYYALHGAEAQKVALAIAEHYHPRFAQDTLPSSVEGMAVALADRLDSLLGIFGIGKKPTGDKDPYGLRRLALGVLRILIEKKVDLDLEVILNHIKNAYQISLPEVNVVELVLEFSFERLRAWYQDQNVPARVFEAVLVNRPTNPLDFHNRIQAVVAFKKLAVAESLAAANKRVQNILAKSEVSLPKETPVYPALLKEPAEITLANQLGEKIKEVSPLIQSRNYTDALISLATLREPIDAFFTDVMVMVEDPKVRDNRFYLLNTLKNLFLEIADISLL
jgi:glycyl-tRNA synthetase beta chain